MKRVFAILSLLLLVCAGALAQKPRKKALPVDWSQTNNSRADTVTEGAKGPAVLRAQILLDRAGYSPGEIDAAYGPNLRAAIRGFQAAHQISTSGNVEAETWAALNADSATALMDYEISAEDVAGPFKRVPEDMLQKAALDSLGFQSSLELLGEKFHVSPKVLTLLNDGKSFDRAGTRILVPNVKLQTETPVKAASILIRQSDMTLSALDAGGKVIAQFPVSAGSEHDPLPIGKWKINGVGKNPVFHYNPELFWDAAPKDTKATIAGGPNNPVGVVWIDLSKPHYGIHGTADPGKVGHTQSHGCIRMTNWDAARLALMVSPGMAAVLTE